MGQSWSAARPSANSPPRALFLRSKVRGACESTGGGSNYNQSAPNSRLRGAKSERSLEADGSVKLALAKACQHARRFSLSLSLSLSSLTPEMCPRLIHLLLFSRSNVAQNQHRPRALRAILRNWGNARR